MTINPLNEDRQVNIPQNYIIQDNRTKFVKLIMYNFGGLHRAGIIMEKSLV